MISFRGTLRGTLRGAIIAAALLATACGRDDASPGRDSSPGRFAGAPVILISVDTLRADHLPAYGYRQVETPNIDGLRRDSVLFERVYSHCPMTLPSHASMFTGSLPTENGVRNNIGYRFEGEKFRTLAEELRERGYAAGAAVSSYVLRSDTGIDDGFEFYEDSIAVATAGAMSEHQRPGMETLKHAQAWILGHREQPFFFFLHLYEPHAPYDPPEPFKSRYPSAYDGEIAAADAIVGELVRSLKNGGLYDSAIIIFTSDHGEGLWDHGEDQHGILLYREALWVPLLVKLPGSHQADSISRPTPLSHLFGTVLRLVGIDLPSRPASWFDAETDAEVEARPIYSETLYPRIHLGWSELRSLIDGRYHYIEGPSPELYDLERDPGEARNLITIERRAASRLRREMQAYPATAGTIGEIDPEDARNLAALGYVGTPRERGPGPLPNPRDEVKNLARIKAAFRFADERRLDEAITALRSLLQENPKLLDVWSKLGEVLVESGRYDEAIEAYRSAIAHAERFSPDLALALGFAHLKNGHIGDTAAAADHARLALKTHPREANELLARVALEEGRFAVAEEHVRSALERGDRQPATLLLLADVERAAGKLERALQRVQEAEQRAAELGIGQQGQQGRQGRLQGADYLRGDLLARLDRPEEAAAAYRREIAAFPQHLQAYANLAVILMIQDRSAEANELLEQMARSNPHRGAFLLAAKTLDVFEDRQGAARWRQRAAR
ncbi:MAG TPA: sulfatase-like hydrolase/transferase [Thermoanaerobaculia bacterium]|nr:sulfatase-like hydrolase/transferase [Thermoanaerobaculia bacterium]